MELGEAVKNRRSIRSYQNRPVEEEKIERVLEAARWAPSAGNLQSVEYVVVRDEETRKKLAEASYGQVHVRNAPVSIVVCCNFSKISNYGSRGKDLYSIQESGACIQNLMLAAHSLGLGTCWIGAFDEAKISQIIRAPANAKPVAVITVGYAAEKPESGRKNARHSVFREIYGKG
jgi:nitroreductase